MKKIPHHIKVEKTSYYITSTMTELEVALEITLASHRIDNRAHQGLRITYNMSQHYISIGTN